MNPPIIRLFLGLLVLFALLIGFTSNWSVFQAEDLEAKSVNKRPLFEAQQIKRGRIFSSDGDLIAESVKEGRGENFQYVRRYPEGDLFGNPIGYSFLTQGQLGLELIENDVLTGEDNEFVSIIEQIRGRQQQGSDIVTTLDAGAQRAAMDALAGQPAPGAVVAIEPQTGAVRVMASSPGFDPNAIPEDIRTLNQEGRGSGLFQRSIQEIYPPGSIFKVVTAAAALDSGEVSADDPIDAPAEVEISGAPLANSDGQSYGALTMQDALTNSVNTYFAQVGERIGSDTLIEYMKRFGFMKDPEVQQPDDRMAASGIYDADGKVVDEGFDVGRVAIGQGGDEGGIRATPFQMAEVAATIANDGKLMRPTLVQEVKDPDGRVTDELDPDVQSEVVSEDTANQLAGMMTDVVNEGTAAGLAGNLGGTSFAGKTGTAELNLEGLNQPWFIAFAPVDDPQIAIAATIEECQGCFGGQVAGPIATTVMNEYLNGG